jgi:glycosyltransferase involved in cell wall biosynthesis
LLKIALVTNNPPPYRIPIFKRISEMAGVDFHLIFCCEREPYREWDLPPLEVKHIFLQENFFRWRGNYIHNNFDVIASLNKVAPDVIITNGFNPTYLYAFAYALAKGLPHISMTDGTDISEKELSLVHRSVRRFVFGRSRAFISASQGGRRLYESYGIATENCFQSCLCADNAAFSTQPQQEEKQFDLIFCGRIEPLKNPLFALDVALGVANRLHRKISILFVGSGSEEEAVEKEAARWPELLEAKFTGFATQNELPSLYQSARLFLFPTLGDVWGVVVNEACAAGLPAIVSPHSGAAGELVLEGENGYICELDINLWVERTARLLSQADTYQNFSDRSRAIVDNYTYDLAADGLVQACRHAISRGAR